MKIFSNILLVAGSGRNVGKTSVVVRLIKAFKDHGIVAVKVSPHFHALRGDEKFIYRNDACNIIEEDQPDTAKDSSRFLSAGAQKVFFIQTAGENLKEAFNRVYDFLPAGAPVVIESGGLREYIEPGLFIYIKGEEDGQKAKDISVSADMITTFKDFDMNRIIWTGKEWKLS